MHAETLMSFSTSTFKFSAGKEPVFTCKILIQNNLISERSMKHSVFTQIDIC